MALLDRVSLLSLFPRTVQEIDELLEVTLQSVREKAKKFHALPGEKRTYANTVRAFDSLSSTVNRVISALSLGVYAYPEDDLRQSCFHAKQKLVAFYSDIFMDKRFYIAFSEYESHGKKSESITSEEEFFFLEEMADFRHSGFHLSDDTFSQLKDLNQQLAEAQMAFSKEINDDNSVITASLGELYGVDASFIEGLSRDSSGNCIIPTTYPARDAILPHCHSAHIRKKLHETFLGKAYPENVTRLNRVISLRDSIARLAGYDSYAEYSLKREMVGSVQRAQEFIVDLMEKASKKSALEFRDLFNDLPSGVVLREGKMEPYDYSYSLTQYKKKHFSVDPRAVAEYFPMENTVTQVLAIYEHFLGLKFEQITLDGLWHDSVQCIEISNPETSKVLGYLFLDLFPRKNKYSHACFMPILPSVNDDVFVGVIIANFPEPTKKSPGLWLYSDVQTFFHEFGHAMHSLLGRTSLASVSGTNVRWDFVETPSQMFEEWLSQSDVVRKVSKHFITGESITDELLHPLLELKKTGSGEFVRRQCVYSLISLELFGPGEHKDSTAIVHNLFKKYSAHIVCSPNNNMHASFGHLMGYGARYYGYMWAKVFAVDVFSEIQKRGVANSEVGRQLVDTILSKGGSCDPNHLLRDFLGREPSSDAFIESLGLET